ncbi:MAG: F0F1 ATP synthase subunit epsilon [Moraxella sp.]|nr:F0F1 ATP synthase subunit epsilon [Moraxella sp.]
MATFKCRVVSAKESLFVGDVKMLIAAGHEGEIGILAGHTPLITLLKPGVLRVQMADDSEEVLYVKGGVLEVQPHSVTVLADTAERAANLDEVAIAEARRQAQQMLVNQSENLQTTAALAALAESVAQLQAIQKYKNRA